MKPRHALLATVLGASSLAWGESPEFPERIAQLSYVEGQVAFQGAQETGYSGLPDRPLAAGDRLATHDGARAEIALGAATVRLDERSKLALRDLDEASVRIGLDSGIASVILRDLREDETFELATPNATVTLAEPGEYRIEARSEDLSVLSVRGGAADVATAGGPVRIASGQRVRLTGREALASLETPRPADAFDDWVLEREVLLAEAEPPRDDLAYEELDRYGEWYEEPHYGRVWMPSYAYGGWDPFHYGYWQSVGFGYAWVDPMPWSFYTIHGGHWAYLNHLDRWCWVPRRDHDRNFARDTRPFGGLDRRVSPVNEPDTRRLSKEESEDASLGWRGGDDDLRRPHGKTPVARSAGRRAGTFVPSGDRVGDSSRKATAPAAKPQGDSSSSKSSGRSSARRSDASSTMTSRSTRESGARPLP